MADGTIIIDEPAVTDKLLDTESLTVGLNTVQRERVRIAGAAATDLAPVSGTDGLLVNLGANNDVTVTSISAGDNNIGNVDIVTVPAPLSTTGGGTEAAALRVTVASDSTGVLSVDDNGASLTVDNAALSVTGGGVELGALRVTLASDSTGVLSVDDNGGALTVDGTVTANLAAGTNNIGDVDVLSIAAGDNNIGNVDIVTMPNVTLAAGTNTNEVVGDAAHDAAVAGNPVLVAGVAQNTDDTAPPNRVSAESDATRLATDLDGALFVRPYGPQVWSYHSNGSTALTAASVHAAPGAGLSLYVTDIVVSSGAATAMNVFFEEGASTVLGPYYLEAVAGRGLHIKFGTPKKITANTALTVTTSAAIAHSVDVTGFTAQG